MPVPIIDLFAGPGGLGEGFARRRNENGDFCFRIGLSIEKDPVAHRTLTLRAVFRLLQGTSEIAHYYRYITGHIEETEFREIPSVAAAFEKASKEAQCLELGKSDEAYIDHQIREALEKEQVWVLIGGPPCQAYSVAGRSRRSKDENFQNDEKHFLYKEYLRIIKAHKPTVFVMENVKGLLSSKHSGNSMFEQIIKDLSRPADDLEYEIRSFTKPGDSDSLDPLDYIISAEQYGIPQRRHRVILLGVRKGVGVPEHVLLKQVDSPVTVKQAIGGLPRLRSKLSKADSFEDWAKAIEQASSHLDGWLDERKDRMIEMMRSNALTISDLPTGGKFLLTVENTATDAIEFEHWVSDEKLGGVCQHESRGHMSSDLMRYMFSACHAKAYGRSPLLDEFPRELLPNHSNVKEDAPAQIPFKDRFRVQCIAEPASTVVAHIAKDGHYYIHYDPSQCRSLTVREAARLQTFPDNYFFEGNRTEQYTQIGNAVPPLLANKLAQIVYQLIQPALIDAHLERKIVDSVKPELMSLTDVCLES